MVRSGYDGDFRYNRFMHRLTLLLFVPVLAGCGWLESINPDKDRDMKTDPQDSVKVELFDVVKDAEGFVGFTITFDAIYNQKNEDIWSPMRTMFTPEKHVSFSVWLPCLKLDETTYSRLLQTLFIRKGNPHLHKLYGLERFRTYTFRGKVLNFHKGIPWIEVYDVIASGDKVPIDFEMEAKTVDEPSDGLKEREKEETKDF